MRGASDVGRTASDHVTLYLKSLRETAAVENVEDDPAWRKRDVDLLWHRKEAFPPLKVEVKGDRHHYTGNYFLETVSREERGTPGCFLYTEADLVAYYFVPERELHLLPMPSSRDWFLANLTAFEEKRTSTPVGGDFYVTVGRLVPRARMRAEVEGIRVVDVAAVVKESTDRTT